MTLVYCQTLAELNRNPSKQDIFTQYWVNVGPPSAALALHYNTIGSFNGSCGMRGMYRLSAYRRRSCVACPFSANTRHWTNVGLMLGQRRRRWANIKPTLVQWVVFAGFVGQPRCGCRQVWSDPLDNKHTCINLAPAGSRDINLCDYSHTKPAGALGVLQDCSGFDLPVHSCRSTRNTDSKLQCQARYFNQ